MQITTITSAELECVKSLWLSLHSHHRNIAPDLEPYVGSERSWKVRRATYEAVLSRGGAIYVASEGAEVVGYAAAEPHRMTWPATFRTEPNLVEILTLSVRPDRRQEGIGTRLLDEIDRFAESNGMRSQMVGLVRGNCRAAQLYVQRGFRPTWMTLTNFGRQTDAMAVETDVVIEKARLEEVEGFRDLWLSVHHHHKAVSPELGPFVSDDRSWEVFKPIFRRAAEHGLLLRAGLRYAPAGFACIEIADRSNFADTWHTGPAIAEIEVMAVDEASRGHGIGSALLNRISSILAEANVNDCCVGAIWGNAGALRLYERAGFCPTWVEMTRLGPA